MALPSQMSPVGLGVTYLGAQCHEAGSVCSPRGDTSLGAVQGLHASSQHSESPALDGCDTL